LFIELFSFKKEKDKGKLYNTYIYIRSSFLEKIMLQMLSEILFFGVPVVAQGSTNLTRNHEVAGLIPSLAQWVKELALP